MKYRAVIFLKLLLALFIPMNAQNYDNKSLLVLCDGKEYLLPFIEETLVELTAVSENDSKVLGKVTSFNRLYSSFNYDVSLREAFSRYSNEDFKLSQEGGRIRKLVAQEIINHELILVIKVNEIQSLIEYQFDLFDVEAFEGNISDELLFPVRDPTAPIYSSSFFISPELIGYRDILKEEIKRIFPKSNYSPICKIGFRNKVIEESCEIYVNTGDTLAFFGDFSYDEDTPNSLLQYNWQQKININDLRKTNERLKVSTFDANQSLVIPEAGEYYLSFFVSDRIAYSDTLQIKIVAIDRIVIQSSNDNCIISINESLFDQIRRKKVDKFFTSSDVVLSVSNSSVEILSSIEVNKVIWDENREYQSISTSGIIPLANGPSDGASDYFEVFQKEGFTVLRLFTKFQEKEKHIYQIKINYRGLTSNDVYYDIFFFKKTMLNFNVSSFIQEVSWQNNSMATSVTDNSFLGGVEGYLGLRLFSFLEIGFPVQYYNFVSGSLMNTDSIMYRPRGIAGKVSLVFTSFYSKNTAKNKSHSDLRLGFVFSNDVNVSFADQNNRQSTSILNDHLEVSINNYIGKNIPMYFNVGLKIPFNNNSIAISDNRFIRFKAAIFGGVGFLF